MTTRTETIADRRAGATAAPICFDERRTAARGVADTAFTGGFEALLLEHLPYVEKVIAYLARRHALDAFDRDDFGSWVKLRLLQDDCAILRKFEGRSKLTTFLTTVVNNLYRDFRIRRWGKWRESAAARRLGEVGVQLESLLYRDGRTAVDAIRVLRENYGVRHSEHELEAMIEQLKPRSSRRFETEEALAYLAAPGSADADLRRGERSRAWQEILERVKSELAALDPEDRTILRMHFEDGVPIAAVARELGLDQRGLYRRVQRLLDEVRARFSSR